MKDPKDIAFVRLDVLENWRFWNGFRNDLEAAGREAIAEADALLAQDPSMNERAARLMNESIEFRKKKQTAGQAGGFAKANNRKEAGEEQTELPARRNANLPPTIPKKPPKNMQEVYDFAQDQGIWMDFARDWFARNYEERDGVDMAGNRIKNWKGALINDWKKNGGK